MEHFDQDKEMISELLEVFKESFKASFDSLKVAIKEEDYKNIELHAHTIKGMVSNFFADEIKESAFELEKMGKNQTLEAPRDHVEKLDKDVPELVDQLREFCG